MDPCPDPPPPCLFLLQMMAGPARCLVVFFGVTWILVTPVTPDVGHDRGDPGVRLFYREPWLTAATTPGEVSAVGGVCPSMCENGGTCVVEEGKYRCRCTAGFTGYKCQGMRLDLACDQREMRLRVVKSVLTDRGVNASDLRTSSGGCAAVESPLYVSITLTHEDHARCGTQVKVNGTHLIYSNQLGTGSPSPQPEVPEDSVSRSADIRISFSCVYQYDQVVSLPFPLLTSPSLVTFVVEEGEFNVSMTLHPSEDFGDPYARPPIIPLTGRLYVQVEILGHDPQGLFTLGLDECWATPGPAHSDRIRHLVISSGIANDSTAAILESGDQSVSRFSLQMFHFVRFPEFYLHCRVWLHQPNGSRCCDRPQTNNSRHVRDLSDPYRKVVSCGPIRPIRSPVAGVGKTESGLSPVIFPASAAAAAILVLLGLVTIAKVLKRRAKLRNLPPIFTLPHSVPPCPPCLPPCPPTP